MICFFFGHKIKDGKYITATEHGDVHIRPTKYCDRQWCGFRLVWIEHLQQWVRINRVVL